MEVDATPDVVPDPAVEDVLCEVLVVTADEEVEEAEDDCVVLPSLIVTVRVFG